MMNIILPTVVMIWAMKKYLMPPTEAKQHKIKSHERLTFLDIGGNEAAKEALLEIADYIKNPERYQRLGIRLPKGVLLYGPPGTGKTLMAKALAYECGIPFQYASGADFVEIYAGVGPKRVRDLFMKAREVGKCIIFIDEIDSLGGERGKGNACKEFDNTLNQLLTEMDGFNESEGITVIAATNQENHIDEALLRPGRFDRKIKIDFPDLEARTEILSIHLKKRLTLLNSESLRYLAQRTEKFTGADLENLVNEAAFYSLKQNEGKVKLMEDQITFEHLQKGLEKVTKERDDLKRSKLEKLLKQQKEIQNKYMLPYQQKPNVIEKQD